MGLVVVLDDELDACRLMQRVICAMGHVVHAFTDHQEALEWVRGNKPDLAVIDIKLRGASGFSVLQSIQQMLFSTKVIMVTGCPTEEAVERSNENGGGGLFIQASGDSRPGRTGEQGALEAAGIGSGG